MSSIRSLGAAAIVSAAAACSAAVAGSQVTLNLSTPIDHAAVSAREWNGEVYTWDLVPIPLGSAGAGTSVFDPGNHYGKSWAIFATCAGSGMATSINASISPPTGLPFSTVFPSFDEATLNFNASTLSNGAFDGTAGFAAFNFVLTNQEVLHTDSSLTTIDIESFPNAAKIGAATFGVPAPGPMVIGAVALVLVWTRRRVH